MIKQQIDEILDRSEIFSNAEDGDNRRDLLLDESEERHVVIRAVNEGVSFKKYIPAIMLVAAAALFIVAVKNYTPVKQKTEGNQIPLVNGGDNTSGTKAGEQDYKDNYERLEVYFKSQDNNSLVEMYKKYTVADGYDFTCAYASIIFADGSTIYVQVPVYMEKVGSDMDCSEIQKSMYDYVIHTYESSKKLCDKNQAKYSLSIIIDFMVEVDVDNNDTIVMSVTTKAIDSNGGSLISEKYSKENGYEWFSGLEYYKIN